jgi:hypothetical protein
MSVNLTGVLGDLTSALPSSSDILQQVIIGAGASVVLAGLKSNSGLDAVDPLHILPRPAVPATATTPAQPGGVSVVVGKTIPGSAFAAMSPATQASLMAAGYTITAG